MVEKLQLTEAREAFIRQWGVMGSNWGINRTMAQIHALIMVARNPLSTDDVMEALAISRGNAHTNLKELVSWGLVRSVIKKGERKEFFEGEKEVWKIFQIILRERKRREVDPVLAMLEDCADRTAGLKSEDAATYHKQITELQEFVASCSSVMDKVAASKRTNVLGWALKYLK
jgi:DNA-binding transcriptional regulator GbsR (MarR family)